MNDLMKEIGAVLRPLGFRGSRRRWTLDLPGGEAVILRENASISAPGTRQFYLRTSYSPSIFRQFHEWEIRQLPLSASPPILRPRSLCQDAPRYVIPGFSENYRWTIHGSIGADGRISVSAASYSDLEERLLSAVNMLGHNLIDVLMPERCLSGLLAAANKTVEDWKLTVLLLAAHYAHDEVTPAIMEMTRQYERETVLRDDYWEAALHRVARFAELLATGHQPA